jgi:hypothetical protein
MDGSQILTIKWRTVTYFVSMSTAKRCFACNLLCQVDNWYCVVCAQKPSSDLRASLSNNFVQECKENTKLGEVKSQRLADLIQRDAEVEASLETYIAESVRLLKEDAAAAK